MFRILGVPSFDFKTFIYILLFLAYDMFWTCAKPNSLSVFEFHFVF
jgi:hypothetical protein